MCYKKFALLFSLNVLVGILKPVSSMAASGTSKLQIGGLVSEKVVVSPQFRGGRWRFRAKSNSNHPYFVSYALQNGRKVASLSNRKNEKKPYRISVTAL